jgi:hypothetical protein
MDAFALEFLFCYRVVGFPPPIFFLEGVEIPLVTTVPWPRRSAWRIWSELKFLRKRQASRQAGRQANSIAYCERVRLLYTPFY